MGFVSCFEDISDRLIDSFNQLKKDTERDAVQLPPEKFKAVKTVIEKGEKLLEELEDIATRPDLNHYLEIWNLKNKNSELQRSLDDARKKNEFYMKQIKQMKIDHELNIQKEKSKYVKIKRDNEFLRNQKIFYNDSFGFGYTPKD